MDTTLIGMLATTVGTGITVVALISRSIGSLRSHMDGRIDALEARVARIGDDVVFIKGRLTTQPDG